MKVLIIMVVLAMFTLISAYICFVYPRKIIKRGSEYYKKRNMNLLAAFTESKMNRITVYFCGLISASMCVLMILGIISFFLYPQSRLRF